MCIHRVQWSMTKQYETHERMFDQPKCGFYPTTVLCICNWQGITECRVRISRQNSSNKKYQKCGGPTGSECIKTPGYQQHRATADTFQ